MVIYSKAQKYKLFIQTMTSRPSLAYTSLANSHSMSPLEDDLFYHPLLTPPTALIHQYPPHISIIISPPSETAHEPVISLPLPPPAAQMPSWWLMDSDIHYMQEIQDEVQMVTRRIWEQVWERQQSARVWGELRCRSIQRKREENARMGQVSIVRKLWDAAVERIGKLWACLQI